MLSHLITDKAHIAPLEGWRGVLALMVVSLHFSPHYLGGQMSSYGYLAVDFFFALSGFIIARQYEAAIVNRKITFKKFAVRRMARLYPLYMASVLFAIWINQYLMPWDSPHRIQSFGDGPNFIFWLLVQLFMAGCLFMLPQPNGPTWSVSAEWVVNITFFALLWRYRRIPNLLLWVMVALGTLYLLCVTPQTLETPTHYVPIVRAFVGFPIGWLIFRYYKLLPVLSKEKLYAFEILLIAITLIWLSNHKTFMLYGGDYFFLLALMPTLICISLYRSGIIGGIFSLPGISFLGRISYSIYLMHYPWSYVFIFNPDLLSMGYPWVAISYTVSLIIVSILTYNLIEKPGRWVGRYFTSSKAPKEPKKVELVKTPPAFN